MVSTTNRYNTMCKARRQLLMQQHYGKIKTLKVVPFPMTLGNINKVHLRPPPLKAKVRVTAVPLTARLIKVKVRPQDHNNRAPQQGEIDHLLPVSAAYLGMVYTPPKIVLALNSVAFVITGLTHTLSVSGRKIKARTMLIVLSIQDL